MAEWALPRRTARGGALPMVITCPNCSTRFKIDPAAIGEKGRMVRCSACKHRWFVEPPPAATPLGSVLPQVVTAPAMGPLAPPPPRPRRAPVSTLWLTLVVGILLAAAIVVGRDRVASLVPATVPWFAAIGLPAAVAADLEIVVLGQAQETQGDKPVLVIKGEVMNTAQGRRDVPRLRISLLDDKQAVLRSEDFYLEPSTLEGGERRPFEQRIVDVPEAARNFSVTFAGGS
jgi:predicted Zn finger-like uncharacterized protein